MSRQIAESATVDTARRRCIRCDIEFTIGSKATCSCAPDGGEHEPRDVHLFEDGRHDGRCSRVLDHGLMCGFPEWEEQIHVG